MQGSLSLRTAGVVVLPALAVLVAGALALEPSAATSRRPPAASRSPLAPDPGVIRYRFATATTRDTTLADTIAALEQRDRAGHASAIDLADLADLYVRRAQRTGDLESYVAAESTARRSLDILPAPNGAALTLARVANARHEFRVAIELVRAQLVHARRAPLFLALATSHLALGELAEAAEAAEAAVALKPDTSTYLMRALVLQAQGRDDEATHDLTRAAAVEDHGDPEEGARLRALWGRFLVRRGALAEAAPVLAEALRIVPQYPLALAQQAELALRRGDAGRARALFEQAFASSREVRYLIDLARAQELAADADAAARVRAQVERMIRADLAAHGFGHQLDLVEVLVDRGGSAELREAISLARDELARRPSAEVRFQLARALVRSGAHAEAAVHVRTALATGARDARLYELAARVETGPRAAVYARLAAALDPHGAGWRTLGMDAR